jgi:integrase
VAAVRPEFRAEVLVPDPADPVLGLKLCAVAGCDRTARGRLCGGHNRRWNRRGRPDPAAYLADPGPPLGGRGEPLCCAACGCRYARKAQGLCGRHYDHWKRAGRPDLAAWAAGAPALPVLGRGGRAECRLPFCSLWAEPAGNLYCSNHTSRWKYLGCPGAEEFTAHCERLGKAHIDFRGLGRQVKLELQFAVQCRCDEQTVLTPPDLVNWAVRQARDTGSLLERTAEQWRQATRGRSWPCALAFLLYARDAAETLRDGVGWDVEYPRDTWRLSKLPGLASAPGRGTRLRALLRFDRITQPWLRPTAKRWARLRLTSGLDVDTVARDIRALTRFSAFLAEATPPVEAWAGIDRPLLERYLAWLATQACGQAVKDDAVGTLHMFFQAIRRHSWEETLPATAAFFAGDCPPRPPLAARHLAEHVMAQVEQPANLDRWPDPDGRLVTLILIRCGLRASDACTLPFDCLLHDGQGAPYLRYFNNKMKREAAVPVDEELEVAVRAQQRRVSERRPGCPHLFPRQLGNAGGQHSLTYNSYRAALQRWLVSCDIRDEHGQPVHLTAHQWRHTFATRLINRDVPQEVVRVLLDHDSPRMTAHYARLTDQTVRRQWEQATKVNIKGERVALDPDGPLAQAQWAKTRYGIATQTLANGYCGLPVQRSCPHANSCLTCPVFLTGPEFLPELREQRHRTLTLVEVSEGKGQARVAEMNRQVLTNLDRMIGEIEKDEQTGAADAG